MDHLRKLYVSLDAILDLRLGAMNLVSTDFAQAVTRTPAYYLREEDVMSSDAQATATGQPWGAIPHDVFERFVRSSGKNAVTAALKTKLAKFVRVLCATHLQNVIKEGQDIHIEIEVNTWPYDFHDRERVALAESLQV